MTTANRVGLCHPRHAHRARCRHLGPLQQLTVKCASCVNQDLDVFACAVHGTCTREKRGAGVTGCCNGCNCWWSLRKSGRRLVASG